MSYFREFEYQTGLPVSFHWVYALNVRGKPYCRDAKSGPFMSLKAARRFARERVKLGGPRHVVATTGEFTRHAIVADYPRKSRYL
jgi:hypothetical protein